ncbi:hypothetical protein HMPREF1406_01606 [Helicobacter pylori GAM239Bi]|nr:hypothetical protein HMPREF1406_01606 [Helicobacter pylori GAM239Bi]
MGVAIKKGVFNFDCLVWLFEICCNSDFFLNFLKRIEKYSVIIIPQKLKGFFKKAVVSMKR